MSLQSEMPDVDALQALFDFYVEAGVNCALDDHSHDRFAEFASLQQQAAAQHSVPTLAKKDAQTLVAPPSRRRGFAAASVEDASLSAREVAARAQTLDELRDALAEFESCALRFTAKTLAFSDGNPTARVMFVGEAPGAEEDKAGVPFVGRSGQLLNRMLAAIGLDRTSVYIANIVPWRPPGNRTPTTQETAICQPFIARQIALVDPDILVCLGGPAAGVLLNIKDGILKSRGRWMAYDTGQRTIRALASLHPAYLLRQPLQKRLAYRDFRLIRSALPD